MKLTIESYDVRDFAARELVDLGIELSPEEWNLLRRPLPDFSSDVEDKIPFLGFIPGTFIEKEIPKTKLEYGPPQTLLPLPDRSRSSRALAVLERNRSSVIAKALMEELSEGDPNSPLTKEVRSIMNRERKVMIAIERKSETISSKIEPSRQDWRELHPRTSNRGREEWQALRGGAVALAVEEFLSDSGKGMLRIFMRTSTDEGVTWSEPTLLADRPLNVSCCSIFYPTLIELSDGTLAAVWAQKKDAPGELYGDIHAATITLK